jgi:tRNA-dihydrouridine synthase B
MGCPAKKVCKKVAGSALMKDEKLVSDILLKTVAAVNVPVTLKIRTGWCNESKNALNIAKIAEESGIQSLAIHGRTRDQKYTGSAEYDTIAHVKSHLSIPVIANGDINSPQQAKNILEYTKADGLMIGRAAQGSPWIFNQISSYLKTGEICGSPHINIQRKAILSHLKETQQFYGEIMGHKIARKHIGWYLDSRNSPLIKKEFNKILTASEQIAYLKRYFDTEEYRQI